jgi:hypothetical protein
MFIWIENSFSPNLRSCINYNSAQDSANSNKSKNLVIRELLGRQTICTMRLIDRHNGFFSAIVTALLALIAWRQAFIAREQSNTSRAQLRAYVMVDKATTVDFGPVPKAEVIFKNYGQTPAYNLTIWTSVEVAVDDLKNKAAAPPSGPAASGSLGPGGFVHTLDAPERVILPPEVQAVKEGLPSMFTGKPCIETFSGRPTLQTFASFMEAKRAFTPVASWANTRLGIKRHKTAMPYLPPALFKPAHYPRFRALPPRSIRRARLDPYQRLGDGGGAAKPRQCRPTPLWPLRYSHSSERTGQAEARPEFTSERAAGALGPLPRSVVQAKRASSPFT